MNLPVSFASSQRPAIPGTEDSGGAFYFSRELRRGSLLCGQDAALLTGPISGMGTVDGRAFGSSPGELQTRGMNHSDGTDIFAKG